jgi:pilus assembly protein Flp/PilA
LSNHSPASTVLSSPKLELGVPSGSETTGQSNQRSTFVSFAGEQHNMRRLLSRLFRFVRRDDGPTAVEYAILLALIITVCITSIRYLGRPTRREFRSVSRTILNANNNAIGP